MARYALIVVGIVTTLSLLSAIAARAMTSTNYQILWDSINIGGEDTSTSTNYRLRDTIGEHGSGTSSSETYKLSAGYRVGDMQDMFISFNIGTQENSTETAYSAFSNSGKTVTVSSAASFAVGQFIGVVENKGLSELVAVGKITSISGTVITVDAWDGEPSSLTASPGGSDDFVYRMNGSSADFGVRSLSAGQPSLSHTNILTNASNGYHVDVQVDGNFRTTGDSIINVSDGAVTTGKEEYGGEVVGSTAQGTGGDFAFSSTSTRIIQQSSAFGNNDRVALIYKLSTDSATPAGNYTQIVTYTATANF